MRLSAHPRRELFHAKKKYTLIALLLADIRRFQTSCDVNITTTPSVPTVPSTSSIASVPSISTATLDEHPHKKQRYSSSKFAWIVLFSCFVVQLIINGLFFVFAILLIELLPEFEAGYGSTSLIIGIQTFCFCFFGGCIGQAVAKYGCRAVGIIGAVSAGISIFLSSLSTELWHVMLNFGVFYGIAQGLMYYPSMAIILDWFPHNSAQAIGIATSGMGIGCIVFPPITNMTVQMFGWRGFLQVSAAILGGLGLLAALTYSTPKHLKQKRQVQKAEVKGIVDFTMFRDPVFILMCLCMVLLGLAYYAPPAHIVAYAMENGVSHATAGQLIMYFGATTFIGRIVLGYLGGFISPYYMFVICIMIAGISTGLGPFYQNDVGFIVYYSVFGFFSGAYACMFPALVATAMGPQKFAQAFGFTRTAETASVLLSPALAGWIRDVYGSYDVAFVVVGVVFCASVIPILVIPSLQERRIGKELASNEHSKRKT